VVAEFARRKNETGCNHLRRFILRRSDGFAAAAEFAASSAYTLSESVTPSGRESGGPS
jgi:hypothetical protein